MRILALYVCLLFFFLMIRRPPRANRTYTLFPYTTLFRSIGRFGIETAHAQIVWRMFYGRVLAHPSVMFRDDVVRAAGGYDPNVEVAQDLDLWSRLVGKTRFASLPPRLVRYRSTTGARSEERRVGKECGSGCRSGWWP